MLAMAADGGSTDPPAVRYRYSPSWHSRYPQRHLSQFCGKRQVDGYAGFDPLFVAQSPTQAARVLEIACIAHLRRKFFDLYKALNSPVAQRALERIAEHPINRIEDLLPWNLAKELN